MAMETMETLPRTEGLRRVEMKEPDDVSAMLRLKALGWGARRIAAELGCSRTTVRRWLREGGWRPAVSPARATLARRPGGLARRALPPSRGQCRRGAPGARGREGRGGQPAHGGAGGGAVAPGAAGRGAGDDPVRDGAGRAAADRLRAAPRGDRRGCRRRCSSSSPPWVTRGASMSARSPASARSTGSRGWRARSRLSEACPRRSSWTTPAPWCCTTTRPRAEVVLNPKLHAFARHWGFRVRACAPYRARTKGKDERGCGLREAQRGGGAELRELRGPGGAPCPVGRARVADVRVHGTTGEAPMARFVRDEAAALRPLPDRGPFLAARELSRRVGADCAVEVDTNAYSVPWRLIGERVHVLVTAKTVAIVHAGVEVARHPPHRRPARAASPSARHFAGVAGAEGAAVRRITVEASTAPVAVPRPAAAAGRVRGPWSGEAGDGDARPRPPGPNADAPEADGRCATSSTASLDEAARGGAEHARDAGVPVREGDRPQGPAPHRDELRPGQVPVRPHAGRLRLRRPALARQKGRSETSPRGRFIANGDALLLLGPPGVGKTHFGGGAGGARQSWRATRCSSPAPWRSWPTSPRRRPRAGSRSASPTSPSRSCSSSTSSATCRSIPTRLTCSSSSSRGATSAGPC